jgi:putative endonuclease
VAASSYVLEMNYTYMLKLKNGNYYCGWTNDIKKRLAAHQAGTASKCTRAQRPVELVWLCESDTRQEAMSMEWHVKQLSRSEKEKLIEDYKNGNQKNC